ncbi:MAG: glutamine-hydrolyzing carbamoyl-phosphate synthase small subunit [Candidatus Aminicenantes bacterium]|nr:MAG: glutamine-hydrolyzing carbamoyl-phosphate synthase small subunit [Candidatus Aminicenantes bacterium]
MALKKATLILEGGDFFIGQSIGYDGNAEGEIVFNTSMTGYQEILTDPSYKGQIVTMTYPLIGNYGCNFEDVESRQPWVEGFIIKELAVLPSNWRNKESLPDFLKRHKIVAIQGVDTRKLTKIIRAGGAQRALISTTNDNIKSLQRRVKKIPSIVGLDLVKKVTTEKAYKWREGPYMWPKGYLTKKRFKYFVVTYDFGIKRNILRNLVSNDVDVHVVPAQTSWKDIMKMKPHGVLLSNGPGDPAPITYAIENIKNLIGKIPIFGICLGHQLLAIALGGKTYKLKFGHRGANHPVQNLETGAIEITSQNHGFAVDIDSLKGLAKLTHLNLNDMTSEGLSVKEKFLFSVQYHPESSPGPRDSRYLFQDFIQMMDDFKGK